MQPAGVFPPITTPFKDGNLDTAAARANARRWMTTRLSGLVALGTNGEAPYVDEDEAETFVAAIREEVPRGRLLIAGTGRDSTRATIAATARAARAGADAALVRMPAFFKPQMSTAALIDHFTAVAEASPVPVLLYNFPGAFGVDLAIQAVERLSEHRNIVGIKESGGDLAKIAEDVARMSALRRSFAVLCGSAPILHAAVVSGAAGGILAVACVVPELVVELFELARAGRHDEARVLQQRLTPLARSVTSVYGVPGLKAALDLAGYAGGPPRAPLAPATQEAVGVIKGQLAGLGIAVAA
ncbi:MAG TPA: dihydrodipicolinate synthase family protein [Vicinamibacterales bacterium]|nr:dihydrodipicolinate synthase family protein [Vicinamibacterales bacterium]